MADIDTRPVVVNITHCGGDTLTIKITAPDELIAGMQWDAQVKDSRDPGSPIAASFVITPSAAPGEPTTLVLPADVTSALVAGGVMVTKRATVGARAIPSQTQQYVGEWDCQISAAGGDPVRTLVQGTITIERDVTQVVP